MALTGDCDCCWKLVLCFANGFVGDRLRGVLTPAGLFSILGSVGPMGAGGIIDCRNGFVEVCCGCSGSAIDGMFCTGCCCEKTGMPFCGIGDSVVF
jgi:hypothetical protein